MVNLFCDFTVIYILSLIQDKPFVSYNISQNTHCLFLCYRLVRSKDAETAGALMTFFLALGLSLGAAFSFGLKRIV